MTIAYRGATHDDLRFVVSAWSTSYKNAHSAGMIHTDDWASVMRAQIERVIAAPHVRTLIAYESTDPLSLYGFVVGDSRPVYALFPNDPTSELVPVIFYVYVKEPYRRAGCARGLAEALGVTATQPFVYTCRTAVVSRLESTGVIARARWNPLIARSLQRERESREHR
jgi:hypothetical protein